MHRKGDSLSPVDTVLLSKNCTSEARKEFEKKGWRAIKSSNIFIEDEPRELA